MHFIRLLSVTALVFLMAAQAQSQQARTEQADKSAAALTQSTTIENEIKAAFEEAGKVAIKGSASIPLLSQGTLALAEDYAFIPRKESIRILQAMGNTPNPDLIGTIFPREGNWFATITFIKSGYIKDDDAKNWNIDELMQNLRLGTEEANKARIAKGFPPLNIIGWVEEPNYESQSHHLVWSILAAIKGGDNDPSVNYNTFALGREGYFSLNLVSSQSTIEQDKHHAKTLLSALQFSSGKQYKDFVASTDHVAEFGIAALIAGGVAKKLGFFAVIGVFFAKFAKLFIVGGLALVAGLAKLFSRRNNNT